MATTFKVGDKIDHRTFGAGEVAFGPFLRGSSTDNYLMKDAGGEHRMVDGEAMTPAAKFKVGDVALGAISGSEYIVEGGPFFDHSTEWYAVRYANGNVKRLDAARLNAVSPTPEIKVGDKVKVVSGRGIRSYIGRTVTLTEIGSTNPYGPYGFVGDFGFTIYAESVELVDEPARGTVEYGGKTYELGVKYTDSDGDPWIFQRNSYGDVQSVRGSVFTGETVREAVDAYGPLTRVND